MTDYTNVEKKHTFYDPYDVKDYINFVLPYCKAVHVFRNVTDIKGNLEYTYHIKIRISPLRYLFLLRSTKIDLDRTLYECMPYDDVYIFRIKTQWKWRGKMRHREWESKYHQLGKE